MMSKNGGMLNFKILRGPFNQITFYFIDLPLLNVERKWTSVEYMHKIVY